MLYRYIKHDNAKNTYLSTKVFNKSRTMFKAHFITNTAHTRSLHMQWTWHFFYPGNLTAKESWVFTALSVHTFKVTFNRTEIFLSLSLSLTPSFSLKLWIGPCRVPPWLKFNGIHYGEGGVLRELQEPWLPPTVLGPTHCQREKSGLADAENHI